MTTILQRLSAAAGLLVLVPVGYLLVTGRLGVAEAGIRAAATLVLVLALRRSFGLLGRYLDA